MLSFGICKRFLVVFTWYSHNAINYHMWIFFSYDTPESPITAMLRVPPKLYLLAFNGSVLTQAPWEPPILYIRLRIDHHITWVCLPMLTSLDNRVLRSLANELIRDIIPHLNNRSVQLK